ncbi:Histidine kinase [Labilithrix luteola]|uniref:histidine kinase n=1 Tax=Labilithrix luteola TaxID=1391654 RepID=A0A0K1QGP6_9BACT|nr:ATP-binding protein [Labilithrix luteola]AKV04610.1 Histidine kinase [Labilithrix luteola]
MGEGVNGQLVRADDETAFDLEERLQILTAFAGGIVFEFDGDGRYLRIWAGDTKLLVRPEAQLIGRTVVEVLGPSLGEKFRAMFRRVIETSTPAALEYSLDVGAGRRSFSCQARPHRRRNGRGLTVTLFVRDVTEQKELQAKLVQHERLASLGMIAAGVGHEIRQPLAFMQSSMEVLGREVGADAPPAVRESLANVENGARRIGAIVASLDLLRPRTDRVMRPLDVRRAVEAALDLSGNALEGRAHLVRLLREVPLVSGEEGELCQVFLNLLLNAAQAIPPGDPVHNAVTIETSYRGGAVHIAVRDTGVGIPTGIREHILEPFFTTKEANEGTGLGLYITSRIVESHRGKLEIESSPGNGTTITVVLPVANASEKPEPMPEATTAIRARIQRRRLSVLVVDDEPRVLESLRLVLDGVHRVVTADRASEGLELLREDPSRFDVVLCDLTMADTDGIAFFEEMSKMKIAHRFIVMTGGAFTDRAQQFLDRCVCPTIDKPFMIDDLLALLESVAQRRAPS